MNMRVSRVPVIPDARNRLPSAYALTLADLRRLDVSQHEMHPIFAR